LEAYTASKGILRTASEVMAESDKPSKMREEEHLTPRMITEFCNQGDELAIETYRRTGHILGIGLANYASVIDPEAIIFTGGISKAGKWLLEPTNEAFEAHVFHNVQNKIKLLNSELSSTDCDLLGAGALAWKVEEYSLFK
jgi:glucokinase